MWSLSEHLVQFSFMAAIIWGAQAFARRAHHGRASREARRLRIALGIGLSALRELYEADLASLSGGERPLISGRNQINLLRTQLGRLTSLEPPEVEAVMSASIAVERAETEMAIAGQKVGGVTYLVPQKKDAGGFVASALQEACSMLRSAEELLNPNAVPGGEAAAAVPANASADCGGVQARGAGAPELGRAVQAIADYREKVKAGALSR